MPSPFSTLVNNTLGACGGFAKAPVKFWWYWPEILFLVLSLAAPIAAWLIWCDGEMLERSGSIMFFFALLAEIITLNRMHRTHAANACLIQGKAPPYDFSKPARIIGWVSMIFALLAAFVSGYAGYIL